MNTGIYRLRIGDWFYIGQAKNFKTRWKEHTWDLKADKHHNQILQRAYNKYQTLEFDILAYCTEDKLNSMEQSLIDAYYDEDNCANLAKDVIAPTRGRKHSDETRAKMSISGKARLPFSEETRRKIAIGNTGKKHTDEAKAKVSAANKGRVQSEERKTKTAKQVVIHNIWYPSIREAARQLGVDPKTIRNILGAITEE